MRGSLQLVDRHPLAARRCARSFASGELGFAPPGECAAAYTASWLTPITLKPGTYNFFCRVHPFMRGVFRETKLAQPSG